MMRPSRLLPPPGAGDAFLETAADPAKVAARAREGDLITATGD